MFPRHSPVANCRVLAQSEIGDSASVVALEGLDSENWRVGIGGWFCGPSARDIAEVVERAVPEVSFTSVESHPVSPPRGVLE